MTDYQVNNDWELVSVEVTKHVRPYQNSSYPWLNYSFVIKRHSQGHSAIVIIPALLMALLTLTSFWLEPDCAERVAFCCMIIISHFLYMTYIPIMVPANGNESPLIVLFFRDSLILVTISLVTAVIVQGLSSASMSPPDWVSDPSYRVIHSIIGHWVLPSELRSKGNLTAEEADEEVNSLETTTHKKWRALATIVDRIVFIFFVFSFLSITLKFLI